MEGQLLSGGSSNSEDAAVLRGSISDRRDQLHVLPDAEREIGRRLGGADAVAVQAHAEGAAAHHARQPPEELRRSGQRVLSRGRNARRQTWRAVVSVAAVFEERPAALRRLSRY